MFLAHKNSGADAGCQYAIKAMRKDVLIKRNQVEHTASERAILGSVIHPFIVRLRYAFQTREKLYLVTDFAPGGELFFWLKRERVFSQARCRLYAAELVLAIAHLHSLDIVYRDLKPENILLDGGGHIALTDFGLSKMDVTTAGPEGGTLTFCGTPEYIAPEILENMGHGKAVDWWSLGTLLYEMMAGLPPFYDTSVEAMYEKILSAELVFPRHFLPETKSLLTGVLTRRVEDRLGAGGLGEIQAHPFFAGIDWVTVAEKRYLPDFVPPRVELRPAAGGAGAGAPPTGDVAGSEEGVPRMMFNVEDEFTAEPLESLAVKTRLSNSAEKANFIGFTFTAGTSLQRHEEEEEEDMVDG